MRNLKKSQADSPACKRGARQTLYCTILPGRTLFIYKYATRAQKMRKKFCHVRNLQYFCKEINKNKTFQTQ